MTKKFEPIKFENTEQLDKLSEKYFLSNARSRKTLIIIISASIIAFISYWNSRTESWQYARYQRFQNARTLYYAKKDTVLKRNILSCQQYDSILMEKTGFSQDEIISLNNYLELKKIKNADDLADDDKILVDLVKESYFIKIAILGIHLDVNDLGIFSGLTLSFLLLLYYYTNMRELENLQVMKKLSLEFDKAEYYYYYLSSDQVLTLPPKDVKKRSSLWQNVPMLLSILPLIVFALIFANDVLTINAGFAISNKNSILLLITSSIFLVVITVLTYMNMHVSVKISSTWKSWHSSLNFYIFNKRADS